MEAKKVKLWERRIRKRKTANRGEEEKNKTTCQWQEMVTTPPKPLTDSLACHSLAYPNNKKNWLYWNMESRATTVNMLVSTEYSEVASHSNQVFLKFKAHQSDTSNPKMPSTSAADPHHSAGFPMWRDT